ncbi:COP23 domain-containing protein [Aerosakkonema funiforme]|uniref:COP23 domain-containing protein n=1 Tax=Aerosakkonema funiforme TaxID=1246630 RepID=UPI0035B7E0F7
MFFSLFMLFKEISTQKTRKVFTKVVVTGAIALSSVAIGTPPSQAQNAAARGFFCDTSSGVPVTMYQNAQGTQEPWIRWVSNAFASSGYNPQTRCQEVSGRLETYRRNKQLKYITVGMMNGQRVVCTASQVNGRCENLIFTLKPNQDPIRTLNNLLAWREGQAGAPSLNESGAIPYIDVSGRLGEDASSTPAVAPSTNVQPLPQPSSGGGREL